MKKLVMFLVVVAAGGGLWYWYDASQPVEKAEVVKVAVSRGDIIEAVKATGTIEAIRTVNVGSQVSGIVKTIYADFNAIVTKGQLLAEIDPSILAVQVKIQEATIGQRETDIENQKIQLIDTQRNLARTSELLAKGLANQQQLEASDLAVKNREAQIASAEKQLVSAKANLDQAVLNLSYTKIYSPINGVIVNRVVDEGQAVQSSMNVAQFFTIATDLRQLRLTGGVDEAEIGKVRPGQKVQFMVDAYPNQQFEGTVENVRLNASVQSNVVTYPVWINVQNPDLRLRPSMTANLDIVISRATDVVRVPNTALRFRPNTDIYLALGLTPPQAGQGRAAGAGGQPPQAQPRGGGQPDEAGRGGQTREGGGGGAARGAAGAGPAAEGDASATAGGRTGRGFGDTGQLTPEQARQFTERFAEGGGGRGRRGGGGGRGATQRPANQVAPTQLGSGRIDEYFTPVPATRSRASVWMWNADTKELKQVNLTLGVTDGSMSELIAGELEVGDEVVTSVMLPASMTTRPTQGNPFQQSGRSSSGFGGGGRGGR